MTDADIKVLITGLVAVLALIAFAVFILLCCGITPWPLIAFYWVVLFAKNALDWAIITKGEGRK